MDDDEFKIVVSNAIVSLEKQFTGFKQEFSGFKQEFSEFKQEVNTKLDGIGAFLISSDKSQLEQSHRISLLEDRVWKLENERRQDSA